MKRILFLHSAGPQGPHQGSSDFLAHLESGLGAGYRFIHPKIPKPDAPGYAVWKKGLEKALAGLESGSILIGHSLGGSVLLKFLSEEKYEKPIAGLFLVAVPFWGKDNWQADEFLLKNDFAASLPPIGKIFLYHSRDDDGVPFSHLGHYAKKLPQATVRKLEGRGHVYREGLPELVEDIKSL
ncbi:MAG: serine hydrolase family protein [Fibrobacteres bacterium]|nr:serine hydrolase family protein [Fibrobacterota bacterium]